MRAYPNDSLGEALRNIFDFDIYKPETMEVLSGILIKHGYFSFYSKFQFGDSPIAWKY